MFMTPNYPVFIDGRTDLYGSAFLDQWRNALAGIGWQDLFDQWHIQLVVIERDSALAAVLRREPTWQESYSDTMASVFQQRQSAAPKATSP